MNSASARRGTFWPTPVSRDTEALRTSCERWGASPPQGRRKTGAPVCDRGARTPRTSFRAHAELVHQPALILEILPDVGRERIRRRADHIEPVVLDQPPQLRRRQRAGALAVDSLHPLARR